MTHKELKRLFGLKVQALRRRRGLTQEGLAEAVGKSVDTISNIERGAGSPRVETALDIANTLGVTLAELFDVEERADDRGREHRKAVGMIAKTLDSLSLEHALRIYSIVNSIKDIILEEKGKKNAP